MLPGRWCDSTRFTWSCDDSFRSSTRREGRALFVIKIWEQNWCSERHVWNHCNAVSKLSLDAVVFGRGPLHKNGSMSELELAIAWHVNENVPLGSRRNNVKTFESRDRKNEEWEDK